MEPVIDFIRFAVNYKSLECIRYTWNPVDFPSSEDLDSVRGELTSTVVVILSTYKMNSTCMPSTSIAKLIYEEVSNNNTKNMR